MFFEHRPYPSLKPQILFESRPNCLAIWHGLLDIAYIKDKNGRNSPIFNLIELTFFKAYSNNFTSLKLHILFYGNGLALWLGFPDNIIRP